MARWRGPDSSATTPVDLATDLALPATAVAQLEPLAGVWQRFHADAPLRALLASRGSGRGGSHDITAASAFADSPRHDPGRGMIVLMWSST